MTLIPGSWGDSSCM